MVFKLCNNIFYIFYLRGRVGEKIFINCTSFYNTDKIFVECLSYFLFLNQFCAFTYCNAISRFYFTAKNLFHCLLELLKNSSIVYVRFFKVALFLVFFDKYTQTFHSFLYLLLKSSAASFWNLLLNFYLNIALLSSFVTNLEWLAHRFFLSRTHFS